MGGWNKFTIEKIRDIVTELGNGDKLISTEYIDNTNPIEIQCHNCNKPYTIKLTNFMRTNSRCNFCFGIGNKYGYLEVKNLIEANGDKLLSTEYVSIHDKLEILCNNNHIYTQPLIYYNQGSRCVECKNSEKVGKMSMIRHTYASVKKYIEVENNDILHSLTYVKMKDFLDIECGKCHNRCNITYWNYKNGTKCRKCSGLDYLNIDYIKNEISQLRGDLIMSTEYINDKLPLKVICFKCTNEFTMCYRYLKKGSSCPLCSDKSTRPWTFEEVKQIIENDNNILISTEYKNCHEKLIIQCGGCENEYMMRLNHYIKGSRCKICNTEQIKADRRLSYEYVKKYIEDDDEKLISTTYENTNSHLDVQCNKCTQIYKVCFNSFRCNVRCPKCYSSISKGEEKILNFLNEKGIIHKQQAKLPGCAHKNILKFDFYIKDLNLAIEFQGQQHYKAVDLFGGVKSFEELQIRDKIKVDYCRKNKIGLLIIPYWDYKNIHFLLNLNIAIFKRQLHRKKWPIIRIVNPKKNPLFPSNSIEV
jgi:hypothetical protein